jgi:hypothetical protein
MLVINGANDLLVPQADTFVFEGRAKTEVHMPDTGHWAVSKRQLSISSNPKYLAFAQQFRDGLRKRGCPRNKRPMRYLCRSGLDLRGRFKP